MRRRSWQRGCWPRLLLAVVLVGCLGVCTWRWLAARDSDSGAVSAAEEHVSSFEDGGPFQTDGRGSTAEQDDAGASASDVQDLAARATGNGISVSVCEGELEQVATHLLTSYRDAQNCVLASSGYLDLLGLVWGCVVRGDGWVDVCIVSQDQIEGSCKVSVLHMDTSEVAGVFGEDDSS